MQDNGPSGLILDTTGLKSLYLTLPDKMTQFPEVSNLHFDLHIILIV